MKPPFLIYDRTEIADAEGHLCSCDSPELAEQILTALNIATMQPPAGVQVVPLDPVALHSTLKVIFDE